MSERAKTPKFVLTIVQDLEAQAEGRPPQNVVPIYDSNGLHGYRWRKRLDDSRYSRDAEDMPTLLHRRNELYMTLLAQYFDKNHDPESYQALEKVTQSLDLPIAAIADQTKQIAETPLVVLKANLAAAEETVRDIRRLIAQKETTPRGVF